MIFNSWTFAVFLPVVFGLHYAGRRLGWQVGVLTLASFVFYGWGNPRLLPLLFLSTLINGLVAQVIFTRSLSLTRRRGALVGGVIFNLGILGFFKYAPLLGPLFWRGTTSEEWRKSIPLPFGISFYTFQGISLICEAWWARDRGLPGLLPPGPKARWGAIGWFHTKVWFFKAFFPQLVMGPIVKANEFLHQIECKALGQIDWNGAVRKLVLGFFLKMVVADNLNEATGLLKNPNDYNQLPWPMLVILLYGYSFQIYADFAGYSYIAQGLAKLFGYELPDNFRHPYLAGSLTEFWRRWHLSLSSWLREYLYIPLGGNRLGERRTYLNLFLVMFLGGLWHGGTWSYAFWGIAHGLGLAWERWSGWGRQASTETRWTGWRIGRVMVTFHVVSVLWLLFTLPNFAQVGAFGRRLFQAPGGVQMQILFCIGLFSLPVICQHLWAGWRSHRIDREAREVGAAQEGVDPVVAGQRLRMFTRWETFVYALMLALIWVNAGSPGSFIYFQF